MSPEQAARCFHALADEIAASRRLLIAAPALDNPRGAEIPIGAAVVGMLHAVSDGLRRRPDQMHADVRAMPR